MHVGVNDFGDRVGESQHVVTYCDCEGDRVMVMVQKRQWRYVMVIVLLWYYVGGRVMVMVMVMWNGRFRR